MADTWALPQTVLRLVNSQGRELYLNLTSIAASHGFDLSLLEGMHIEVDGCRLLSVPFVLDGVEPVE